MAAIRQIRLPAPASLVKPERECCGERNPRGTGECQRDPAATDLSSHFQTIVSSLRDDASSHFSSSAVDRTSLLRTASSGVT